MILHTLRGEFKSFCMNDFESISNYFDWVQTIVNHIWVNGKKFDDQQIVKEIMWSLNAKFDYVVTMIEEGKNIFTFTIQGLVSSLCSHEQ